MKEIVWNKETKLAVEHFGEPGQETLLLVSGAMAPASFWPDFFCDALSTTGLFVLRFDNRDFGESTHFTPCSPENGTVCPYTMDDMVSDCIAILDTYKIDKCHVTGHSLGGSIAQLLAVRQPDRLLSATAVSAPILATGCPGLVPPDPEVEKRTWEVFMKNPMYADAQRGIPEFLKVWEYLNGSLPLDSDMARVYTKKIYETETIEPAWNHTAVQEGIPDLFSKLKQSPIPLLFIHGKEDPLVQNTENIRILAQHLEQTEYRILEKAGHVFFNRAVWNQIKDIVISQMDRIRQQAPLL